jgi:hypothetical protein
MVRFAAIAVIAPAPVKWRYRPILLKNSLESARLVAMVKQGI